MKYSMARPQRCEMEKNRKSCWMLLLLLLPSLLLPHILSIM